MKTDLNQEFEYPDDRNFQQRFCAQVAGVIVLAAFITVVLLSLWGIVKDLL